MAEQNLELVLQNSELAPLVSELRVQKPELTPLVSEFELQISVLTKRKFGEEKFTAANKRFAAIWADGISLNICATI